MIELLKKIRKFIHGYTMSNVFNLLVSKNLKKYWINSNKNNFNDLLIKSMEKYVFSIDYKKTSSHHKLAIIKILKLIESSGDKESSSDFQFNKLFDLINFNNHSLVQFFHRNLAYLIFIIFIFIGYKIKKEKMIYLYKPYFNLLILLLVQIILGITTLISGLNLYLAGLHQISTIFLLIFTLMLYKKSIAQFNE